MVVAEPAAEAVELPSTGLAVDSLPDEVVPEEADGAVEVVMMMAALLPVSGLATDDSAGEAELLGVTGTGTTVVPDELKDVEAVTGLTSLPEAEAVGMVVVSVVEVMAGTEEVSGPTGVGAKLLGPVEEADCESTELCRIRP